MSIKGKIGAALRVSANTVEYIRDDGIDFDVNFQCEAARLQGNTRVLRLEWYQRTVLCAEKKRELRMVNRC